MKPPLFFDNDGDVLTFESREAAEQYIEPIDVANNEYVGYDSEGRLLSLSVTKARKVSIQESETEPTHLDSLRRLLVSFLSRVEKSRDWLADTSLQDLFQAMMKYKTV
jgi:hypothetical protein